MQNTVVNTSRRRLRIGTAVLVLSLTLSPSSPSSGAREPAAASVDDPSTRRQMAVTIDDLPAVCTCSSQEDWQQLTSGLLGALTQYEVPAIGFVNEDKLLASGSSEPSPERVALLESWLDAGLELGNHTNTHPSLNRTPLARYQQNVLDGERSTRRLLETRDTELRYFRHPYLHTGRDLETKRKFESFLESHGYEVAPVTVDNSDWIFARAYDLALDSSDDELAQRLGEAYAPYMMAKLAYYEDLALQLLGRPIPQVLLIHANRINADHLDSLLERIQDRGYDFVDLRTALADAAFTHEDTYVGPVGLSWIERWWITEDRPREPFRQEPSVPAWVLEASGIESE